MKRFLALSSLIFTINSFGSLISNNSSNLVNVPQLPGGFIVGGSIIDLRIRPTNGDLDYASVQHGSATSGTTTSNLAYLQPKNAWGEELNLGYIFPCTANDITLSYFHFSTNAANAVSVPLINAGTTGLMNVLPLFNNFITINTSAFVSESFTTFASASAKYDLNQFDLTLGQLLYVGNRWTLHPKAGLRWANIDRDIDTFFFLRDLDVRNNGWAAAAEKSNVKGVGPLIGIDLTYSLGLGFGMVGHFDSALVLAQDDVKTNLQIEPGILSIPMVVEQFTFKKNNSSCIVPIGDMKLGVDYTYAFPNLANSDLTFEAGWQVTSYRNAINRLHTFIEGPFTPNFFITGITTSNLNLNGPYASLVLHI